VIVTPLLTVHELSVAVTSETSSAAILHAVSFQVLSGEALGIVGESGSGKTVLALSLVRLLPNPPVHIQSGAVWFGGQNLLALSPKALRTVRGRDLALVFQEPLAALNPVYTVGQQVSEAVRRRLPVSRRDAWRQAVAWLSWVGLADAERRARLYPHQLSGGMRQRVLMAMALAARPRLLVADEPTSMLDVSSQIQVIDLLMRVRRELGLALVLISHDFAVVAALCERVAVMYAGQIVETGPVAEVSTQPLHPYTQQLLMARLPWPVTGGASQNRSNSQWMDRWPAAGRGCAFVLRCRYRTPRCESQIPPVVRLRAERTVRCWLYEPDVRREGADEYGP
jgi:peptide/nickel transport system ATP-binding protein